MPLIRQACRWTDCRQTFDNPEALLEHLSDDHVGRRSTNNLCLECKWDDCGAQAAKRDHLLSHIKVHLPFKPYSCTVCKKSFKRPQDLKKHEKIHTLEHKASLMSNQPGYKAVRRRRTPAHKEQTAGSADTTLLHTPQSSGTVVDDKSQSKLSASLLQAKLEGSSYHPSTDSDGDHTSKMNYPKFGKDVTAEHNKSPIDDLIKEVVQTKTLSPEYDLAMMDRLNEISTALEEQHSDWTPSMGSRSEIDILQNWLEQLSSNIQNRGPTYPPLEMDPITSTIPSNADYDLYPRSSLYGIANNDLLHLATSDNPLAASLLYRHIPINQTTPETRSSSTDTTAAATKATHSPSFWTPGKQTVHVDIEPIDGPAPFDPVDFTCPVITCSEPQPVHLFETGKVHPERIPEEEKETKDAYSDKRNLMHLSNVFTSSDGQKQSKELLSSLLLSSPPPDENAYVAPESQQDDIKSLTIYRESTNSDANDIPDICAQDSAQNDVSPYARLANQLSELSLKDNGDSWQKTQHERHLRIIDELWDALARSRKEHIARRLLKDDPYFNVSSINSPLVSVE